MRTMYDSTNGHDIPVDAEMVAGYVDGRFAWTPEEWDRFPDAVKVRISAVGATHLAEVFDVEVGCIWPPANVVPLVVAARRAGIDPTVYVNERNDWAPTRVAFDRAGVAHPHWWVANYDGKATVPEGAVAKQYANEPMTGGHYDASAVVDFWPGVDIEQKEDDPMLSNEQVPVFPAPAGTPIPKDQVDTRKTVDGNEALGRALQAGWAGYWTAVQTAKDVKALTERFDALLDRLEKLGA